MKIRSTLLGINKILLICLFLLTGLILLLNNPPDTFAINCSAVGPAGAPGTQFCRGDSYTDGQFCTSSTSYGTCNGTTGAWTYSNCAVNTRCGYTSSTNVSCYASCVPTPTPTPAPTHTCITQCGSSVFDSIPISDSCASHGWSCTPWTCPLPTPLPTPTPTPTPTPPAWYQSVGGDIRKDDGISVPLPTGQYFSAGQTTPIIINNGVIYTSQPSASFGSGSANSNNWLVRNTKFSPSPPGIKTSYAFVNANITKSRTCTYGTHSTAGDSNCTSSLTASACSGITPNCTLSTTITSGTYKKTGDLTLTGSSYTFPANGDFIFLVNGNLTINQNLTVPNTSTAIFIVKGDITVGPGVTNIAGIFSADGKFTINSNSPAADTQLNVSGNIIANAGLVTSGPFTNLRNLGVQNATTPSLAITYRPDFILHMPNFLKKATYSVSEIAPQGGTITVPSNTPTPVPATPTPTPTPVPATPTPTPTPIPATPTPTPTPIPATPTPTPTPIPTYTYVATSPCININVRSSASTTGTVITQVDHGDNITTTGVVTGGSYSYSGGCVPSVSGKTSWLKITKINGTSVQTKFGYQYLYAASIFFTKQ